MADLLRSLPWHAIFAFLIPTTAMVVQMHFPSSSPLDEYPENVWMFIICSIFYCIALGYCITQVDPPYLKFFEKVAITSGSLAYATLISLLVPHSLKPHVFIICLILLFIYFIHSWIRQVWENVTSYVYNKWKGSESSVPSGTSETIGSESNNSPRSRLPV